MEAPAEAGETPAVDPAQHEHPRDYGVSRPPFRRGPVAPRPYREYPPRVHEAAPTPAVEGLVGEDEELVAGRHPVEEAFIARRKAVRLLVVPQRRQALEKLVLHATNLRIPIVEVEGGTLTSLTGFDGHQGIALVTDRRSYAGLDDLLARAIERGEPPFVLVLDSLEDPQNFGSLLRTAEAEGAHGVIYPTRRQAPLSPAAIKASAGAVEHLLLVPVDDLAEALTDLHVRGLRIVGTDAEAPLTARQTDLRGPLAVVVGSEGQGLGPAVRRRCDAVVRIPMKGHVESLNAAVAGSILMYEASSQRGPAAPVRERAEPGFFSEPAQPVRSLADGDDVGLPPETDPHGPEQTPADAATEAALTTTEEQLAAGTPDQHAASQGKPDPSETTEAPAAEQPEPSEAMAPAEPVESAESQPTKPAKRRKASEPKPRPATAQPEPDAPATDQPDENAKPEHEAGDDALLPD